MNDNFSETVEQAKSYVYNLINAEKFDEAFNILNDLAELCPDDPDIFTLRSTVYYRQNDLTSAKEVLIEAVGRFPLNEEIRYNASIVFHALNDYQYALFNYYLVAIMTSDYELFTHVGEVIQELEQSGDASIQGALERYRTELPKLNVITTAYNQKDFLEQTIKSVLEQTYPHLEMIIADDCSTDGTDQMVVQFEQDPRINYKRNEVNLGAGNNGCHAFYNYADGEYVLLLNHDDYLTNPSYLLNAVRMLESNKKLSMVWANCTLLDEATGEQREMNVQLPPVTEGNKYFVLYETKEYPHITSVLTSVFRRQNAVDMKCLTEETKSKDLFLYLKLMLTGDIGFIPDNVGVYRMHNGSISYAMPEEYDIPTILELQKLSEQAQIMMNTEAGLMSHWVDYRIVAYLKWRVNTLKNQNKQETIMRLLKYTYLHHPGAYVAFENEFGKGEDLL